MTAELMQDFNISAAALGNLSAFYFYSYVAMQVPTGIIADTWGPRRLLSSGALVAASGILLFAVAPNIWWANWGRFLIGGSVAVAWVSTLKLAGDWFPSKYFAMISGIALFFGLMGAVFAGPPLRLLIVAFGWRSIMLASAAVTFAICAGVWLIVRDHPVEKGYTGYTEPAAAVEKSARSQIISGIFEVLRYPNVWLLFVIGGGVVGCVLTFGGLWGVPYLSIHHGLSTTEAAALNSTLLVAWGIGGPIFGGLSDRVGRRKPLFILGVTLTAIGWGLILFVSNLTIVVLTILLFITGFTSGCVIISFAFARESVPARLTGTVIGLNNMGFMLGPTLLQPAVGWMLDRNWNGDTLDGVKIYSLKAYHAGFILMIAWIALSFVLLFFTRETFCRPK